MIPTEKIIAWLRESAMGKEGQDRIRMRETADRLEQLTIENLNLKSMVEQLQEINDREDRKNLPLICYIGDTIYVLIDTLFHKKEMRVAKVTGFRRGKNKRYVTYRYEHGIHYFESSVPVDDLGVVWFLSQEESEAALAKVNNDVTIKEEE